MAAGEPNQRGPMKKTSEQARTKEPYVKPAFRFERVFETSALSCGKVHATQSGCMRNRKVS
jgi:hypothetical protein